MFPFLDTKLDEKIKFMYDIFYVIIEDVICPISICTYIVFK